MAHDEAPVGKTNVRLMQFQNIVDEETSPTEFLSGSLFLSGGALIFESDAGTRTEIAAY